MLSVGIPRKISAINEITSPFSVSGSASISTISDPAIRHFCHAFSKEIRHFPSIFNQSNFSIILAIPCAATAPRIVIKFYFDVDLSDNFIVHRMYLRFYDHLSETGRDNRFLKLFLEIFLQRHTDPTSRVISYRPRGNPTLTGDTQSTANNFLRRGPFSSLFTLHCKYNRPIRLGKYTGKYTKNFPVPVLLRYQAPDKNTHTQIKLISNTDTSLRVSLKNRPANFYMETRPFCFVIEMFKEETDPVTASFLFFISRVRVHQRMSLFL